MYDDEGYYVVLPDPDTLPEPYFDGLAWEQIEGELDRLEQEAWENRQQQYMWFEELYGDSGWQF
jgi:hypothetical protein